jgi:hypothetical protein
MRPGSTAFPFRSTISVPGVMCGPIAAFDPTARIRSPLIATACSIADRELTGNQLSVLQYEISSLMRGTRTSGLRSRRARYGDGRSRPGPQEVTTVRLSRS